MTIKTKFSIGDKVYCLEDNRIIEAYITDIKIYVYKSILSKNIITIIEYKIRECGSRTRETEKDEEDLFTSKKKLLKSLLYENPQRDIIFRNINR